MEDTNWVSQQLHLLLTAYGYNLYNSVNRARADDLLVREKASGHLGEAANLLSGIATEYALHCIPPSTREQPFPPAEKMATLNRIKSLQTDISTQASRIRSMAVPSQDKSWAKFRDEKDTLTHLLLYDYELISKSENVALYLRTLTAQEWTEAEETETRTHLKAVDQVARDRERLLQSTL